jgi:hypothetical protein
MLKHFHSVFKFLLFTLFLFPAQFLTAQEEGCGTANPTQEQIEYTLNHVANIAPNRNSGTTGIPIQVHIVQDGGSGGPSLEDLAKALSNLNLFYASAGIEFFYKDFPSYVNDTDLYNFNGEDDDIGGNDTEADLVALFTTAIDAVNVYFVNSLRISGGFDACGYAYFPWNAAYSNRSVMDTDCLLNGANGTFVHEFGHYFNLYHTHQDTEYGPGDPDAENVPRTGPNANCDTNGDLLCDTDADPRYDSGNFNFGSCSVPTDEMDENGDVYTPPIDNVMSYYPDACGGIFTPDQYTRIAQGLSTRQGHSAYSLTASPQSVNVPTGLIGVIDEANGEIDISWTDAAGNEMGYVIERSTTSSNSGFVALENMGLGPNAVSWSDPNIEAFTTYWYRIKPTNGDKDTYSSVLEVEVDLIYCGVGATTCDEFISRVEIGTIDNSSACTDGGYHNYTASSTTVEIGTDYPVTITNGLAAYPNDECGIFADWNQDGDFDDANENITVIGNPGVGPYTATITPPVGAELGDTRFRVRITWNTSATSCGTDSYGESEDYTLNVVAAPLPVEFIDFTGSAKEKHITLNWITATEHNNSGFIIERLDEKQNQFVSLGEIPGAGTSFIEKSYNWLDRSPLAGINYYRLKQQDYDGQFTYSKTVALNWEGDEPLQLFPNPVAHTLNVRVNFELSKESKAFITNSLGQVQEITIYPGASAFQASLDLSSLPSGVYYLNIENQNSAPQGQWFTKL